MNPRRVKAIHLTKDISDFFDYLIQPNPNMPFWEKYCYNDEE